MTADVPTTRAISDEAVEREVLTDHWSCDYVITDDYEAAYECGILVESTTSLTDNMQRHIAKALAQPSDEAATRDDVNRVARILIDEWERVERKPVYVAYIATFADMARAVLAQSSGRGADHALAEKIAQAIEAVANDDDYVWVSGRQALNFAAGVARSMVLADEVTGR